MELMMVLVIIGIVAAIGTPSLMRSIRGNRLRTAASTVVRAGRYARSMAVLRQKDVRLVLNPESGKIAAEGPAGVQWDRVLEGVRIESVQGDGVGLDPAGEAKTIGLTYFRSGRCTPYAVTLADGHGQRITVRVDALAGVRTEGGTD